MTCPAAAVAPEPNAYLDVDRLLVGDIMTSRTAMDVLEVLCDDCGSRFAGTPGERRAVEYVADYWRAVGLENARLEEYAYTGWTRGPAALEILAPAARSLDCISLPYCPAGQVEAELLDLGCGTPEAFARSQALIPGRIVMVSSASPPGPSRPTRPTRWPSPWPTGTCDSGRCSSGPVSAGSGADAHDHAHLGHPRAG